MLRIFLSGHLSLDNTYHMEESGGTDDLVNNNDSGAGERTSDHEVRAVDKDGAKMLETRKTSSNPNKLGRRHGENNQDTPNTDNKSDHDSEIRVKSKHSKKRKVSRSDRENTANKKRKDRSKKRRYDTESDYNSNSEDESDIISLHSRSADEENRSVFSETVSRKNFFRRLEFSSINLQF